MAIRLTIDSSYSGGYSSITLLLIFTLGNRYFIVFFAELNNNQKVNNI